MLASLAGPRLLCALAVGMLRFFERVMRTSSPLLRPLDPRETGTVISGEG